MFDEVDMSIERVDVTLLSLLTAFPPSLNATIGVPVLSIIVADVPGLSHVGLGDGDCPERVLSIAEAAVAAPSTSVDGLLVFPGDTSREVLALSGHTSFDPNECRGFNGALSPVTSMLLWKRAIRSLAFAALLSSGRGILRVVWIRVSA